MFKVFKKSINPLHTYRDYDHTFSSKKDVLAPVTATKEAAKQIFSDSIIITNIHKINENKGSGNRSPKNFSNISEKAESYFDDELENSFRKRHAEFQYHNRTFIFCKTSLYLFNENNKVRQFSVWLTESFLFEILTLLIIIFNAVLLGIRDYKYEDHETNANITYQYVNPIFITYYAAEAILKIISRGFLNESTSYLRSGWNWIDLFVAISGILYFEEALHFFSILRILRVLHWLQVYKNFKSMNDMIRVIKKSFWALIAILGLLIFFMGIFSILGLNLYKGVFDYRCRMTPVPQNGAWQIDSSIIKICGDGYHCPVNLYCGSSYEFLDMITDPSEDVFLKEFNWGLSNFDNFPTALFSVFMIINGNWSNMVQMMSDASSNIIAVIFCFAAYIVCKFFILQLGVAVMLENYTKIKKKENPKKFLINPQIGKMEELEERSEMSLDKNIDFKERWRNFLRRRFPPVEVPSDEYYKNPFTSWAYLITSHALFKYITILLTILNIIVLTLDRYPIDSVSENFINIANTTLVILYVVEVFLRIAAHSLYKFLQENFNIFEFIISILCLIEMIAAGWMKSISILRVFRIMRFMRKDYSWDNFKVLISVVFESFANIVDFLILLGIYMYVFAVLGMKYFAGRFRFNEYGQVDLVNGLLPRANFDTIYEAYTVVFQVIIGEDVLGVVLSSIRSVGWISVIYFIILIITGKYLLIQLFLAITLGNFEENRFKINYGHVTSKLVILRMLRKKRTQKKIRSIQSLVNLNKGADKSLSGITEKNDQTQKPGENDNWIRNMKMKNELDDELDEKNKDVFEMREDSVRKPLARKAFEKTFTVDFQRYSDFNEKNSSKVHPELIVSERYNKRPLNSVKKSRKEWFAEKIKEIKESSLFIFPRHSLIRVISGKVVAHRLWDTLILVCIILSSVLLVLDNPLNNPDATMSKIYDNFNIFFTALFALEMLLKIISTGFLFNSERKKNAYIRNSWNMIDCLVVITSAIDVFSGGNSGLKSLKALRSFRALRPLRVISQNEDLKLIVNALFRVFPSLVNLMIVAGLIMVIGATIGTGFFKGTFYNCQAANGSTLDLSAIITKADCLVAGGSWVNPDINYDNFLQSMLTYFQMINGENWIKALYSGVDSVDIDYQPKMWNKGSLIIYFYIFLLIGNVLIKNLFVGVVIDNFRQMKEELGGFLLLNDMQRDWAEMQIFMQRKKLRRIIPEPENSIRKKCFRISNNRRFEYLIVCVIALNTIFLGLKFKTQSPEFENIVEILNKIFLGIFHIEALIQIIGFGTFYFKDLWNKFEIFILLLTDVAFVLSILLDNVNIYTIPTVLRALQLGKVVKFISSNKHIKILVDTIFYLIPSIVNIAALLFLMMFIYAVLGINLFAGVKLQASTNEYANFQNLWSSLNILIRIAVGQDWPYFMKEIANSNITGCYENQSYQDMQTQGILGCGTFLAYPYFISYVCMVTLILINLFLAIVVGGYIESKKENEAVISPGQMDEFLDKWAEYDPQGTGFISPNEYAFLIHDLPYPLGLKDNASVRYEYDLSAKKNKGHLISENSRIILKRVQLFRDMKKFDVPVYASKVHFSDACRLISYNAVLRTYKNEPKNEDNPQEVKLENYDPTLKSEEKLEEQIKEKLKIKSEYVNRTLAKGWINRYGIIKKLQKEAKHNNSKGIVVKTTSFYAGKYIYTFWKKWRDDKKTYELQLAEKKGIDYEKTFELQQRLANAQIKKIKSMAGRKGKATRNFDKIKSKKTHNSISSFNGMKERRTQNNIPDEIVKQPSLGFHTPRSNENDTSGSEEELQNISQYSRGNFEKLTEYRNNHNIIDKRNPLKRKTSIMSNFAQFKSIQSNNYNNEFWLQSPINNNEKFPVPVTVEIDRFMLNYLEQPEVMSSRSTATLQDDKPESEESSNSSQSSSSSSEEVSSKEIELEDPKVKGSSPGSKTTISLKNEDKTNKSLSLSQREEQKADFESLMNEKLTPLEPNFISFQEEKDNERSLQNELESKLKDKLLDVSKNNLETIEEKHEEDNDIFTRGDLDYIDRIKIKPLNLDRAPSNPEKAHFDENVPKENILRTPNQLTTIVLTSEASPKSKKGIDDFFSQNKELNKNEEEL